MQMVVSGAYSRGKVPSIDWFLAMAVALEPPLTQFVLLAAGFPGPRGCCGPWKLPSATSFGQARADGHDLLWLVPLDGRTRQAIPTAATARTL